MIFGSSNLLSEDGKLAMIVPYKEEEHIISLGLDDTMDDYVCTANISDLTTLSFSPGENVTGIQDFASLEKLNLHSSETITSLDLSALTLE